MSNEEAFFDLLVGQNQAVELLVQVVRQNRIAPAYLFVGPEGVGRSLAARCFVQLLFCFDAPESKDQSNIKNRVFQGNHPDLLWVEPTYLHQGKRLSAAEAEEAGVKRKAPPQIRLEQIREIGQFLSRPALEASRSVVVLEGAQTMAEGAANALLKTLEEPGNATLILIAPAVESLLPTLVSRCQRIPLQRLNKGGMKEVLKRINLEEVLGEKVILELAQGSPGEAMRCWEQLQAIPADLLQRLTDVPKSPRDALEMAKEVDKVLDTEAQLWLVDYLQHFYWQKLWLRGSGELVIKQLEEARKCLLCYAQPRLVWECTLLAICQGAVGGR